jgi:hypothetical protein
MFKIARKSRGSTRPPMCYVTNMAKTRPLIERTYRVVPLKDGTFVVESLQQGPLQPLRQGRSQPQLKRKLGSRGKNSSRG